jgi:cytochrome c-type biogenesis protein CcmH/NrfG
MRDGDYPAATDLLRRALGLQPADAMTRTDLAVGLFEMGDREAGEAALRRALHDQPALLGRVTHVLAGTPHGRFFLRPSAAAAFLKRSS